MRGRHVLTLYKKEWLGILRDRKTITTMLMLSLLLYPILFGVIGAVSKSQEEQFEGKQSRVAIAAMPAEAAGFAAVLEQDPNVQVVESADPAAALQNKELDAVLRIKPQGDNLAVSLEYDERYGDSKKAADRVQAVSDVYKQQTVAARLSAQGIAESVLEPIQVDRKNISGENTNPIFNFLPYIMAMGLIAGALNLGVEITAGEKERNTITTLLVSQLSRAEIAVGKLLTTLTMGILSVLLNLVSLGIGFFVLMKTAGGDLPDGMFDSFSVGMLLQLLAVMLPLGCMASALIVLLGTYARNSKEGNLYNMPLMFLVMGVGFATTGMDASASLGLYAVPILGPLLAIKQIMLSTGNVAGLLISVATSFVYTVLLIFPVVRLYNREDVMFRV